MYDIPDSLLANERRINQASVSFALVCECLLVIVWVLVLFSVDVMFNYCQYQPSDWLR